MRKKIFVLCLPIFAILLIGICYKFYMRYFAVLHIPCLLYTLTGILCPACGGTRSFTALISGGIIKSIQLNPIVIILFIVAIIFYLQLLFNTFGIHKKIVPKSTFFKILLGTLAVYYIIRNFIPFLKPH